MTEYQNIRLPEGFSQVLEETGLLLPPLPLAAVNRLEQVFENFFGTDRRMVNRMDIPADMDAVLDAGPFPEKEAGDFSVQESEESAAGEETVEDSEDQPVGEENPAGETAAEDILRYAGFGLTGYGLQGLRATLLVEAAGLRFGVSLPWSRAFGNPEEERADLAAAFRLADLALRHIPSEGSLSVFIGPEGCLWSRKDGESVYEGDTVASLLDLWEEHAFAAEDTVPFYQWMRV